MKMMRSLPLVAALMMAAAAAIIMQPAVAGPVTGNLLAGPTIEQAFDIASPADINVLPAAMTESTDRWWSPPSNEELKGTVGPRSISPWHSPAPAGSTAGMNPVPYHLRC